MKKRIVRILVVKTVSENIKILLWARLVNAERMTHPQCEQQVLYGMVRRALEGRVGRGLRNAPVAVGQRTPATLSRKGYMQVWAPEGAAAVGCLCSCSKARNKLSEQKEGLGEEGAVEILS